MSPIGKSPVEHASDEIFVYCLIKVTHHKTF